MNVKICALPTCDNVVSSKAYKLGMYPGEYCSRDCVNDAYSLKKSGEPFSKVPEETSAKEARPKKVPHIDAADFGGVGVIRHFCDNSSCANPGRNPVMEIDGKLLTVITLCWKGRSGEYCSNECLKTEKEKEKNMSDENDSPVSAGDTSSKKGGKKAGKKAVATKKAAPKKAAKAASNGVGHSKFAGDLTITVKKTNHGKTGNGGTVLDMMKSGMTVESFKEALAKKDLKGMAGWALKYATENGLATIK